MSINEATHPYNANYEVYNYFFHPLHSKSTLSNVTAVIANIALTIFTVGFWQIPFWIVNRMDQRKVDAWEKEKGAKVDNVASKTIPNNGGSAEVQAQPQNPPQGNNNGVIGNGQQPQPQNPPQVNSNQAFNFPEGLLQDCPIFSTFFTTKAVDEKRADFKPLIAFFKSFKFNPVVNFDSITSYELLNMAMMVGGASFENKNPLIELRTLNILNTIVKNLYNNEELPVSLRNAIKMDFLHRVGSFLDISANFVREKTSEDSLAQMFRMQDRINNDLNEICVADLLKPILESTKNSKILSSTTVKLHSKDGYNGFKDFEYKISCLDMEMKCLGGLESLVWEINRPVIKPGDLIPVERTEKWESKARSLNIAMKRLLRDEPNFKEKYEEAFPGKGCNVDAFAKNEHWFPSNDPTLFEIPLLANQMKVSITVFIVESNGDFTVEIFEPENPEDEIKKELMIGIRRPYTNIAYLLTE